MCIRGKDCIPLLKQTTKLVQGPASSVTIASTYCYLHELSITKKPLVVAIMHVQHCINKPLRICATAVAMPIFFFSISMQQLNVHNAATLLQPIDSVLVYRNCFTTDVVEHRQDILWNGGSEYVADLIQKKLFRHAARQTCK